MLCIQKVKTGSIEKATPSIYRETSEATAWVNKDFCFCIISFLPLPVLEVANGKRAGN